MHTYELRKIREILLERERETLMMLCDAIVVGWSLIRETEDTRNRSSVS